MTAKPLAQQLYERHWGRRECPPWESLYPHLQRTWQKDVTFVSEALYPGMETLKAEVGSLNDEVRELRDLLSRVLGEFVRMENGDGTGKVAMVTGATYDRWLRQAGLVTS